MHELIIHTEVKKWKFTILYFSEGALFCFFYNSAFQKVPFKNYSHILKYSQITAAVKC